MWLADAVGVLNINNNRKHIYDILVIVYPCLKSNPDEDGLRRNISNT